MNKEQLSQFNAFVASRPVKTIPNPYWSFDVDEALIKSHVPGTSQTFDIAQWAEILSMTKRYFRQVYESFGSEAQVLCIAKEDAPKLYEYAIPHLPGQYFINGKDGQEVVLFVLPQENSYHITNIDDKFWQRAIIANGIHPLARIHSHHVLDPYQSPTDYATLNSNTLELVIGHVFDGNLEVGYWLDVRGTNTKDHVWVAIQDGTPENPSALQFDIREIPCGNIDHR